VHGLTIPKKGEGGGREFVVGGGSRRKGMCKYGAVDRESKSGVVTDPLQEAYEIAGKIVLSNFGRRKKKKT